MQVQVFPPRGPLDGLKPAKPAIFEKGLGIWARERPDQLLVHDVARIMSTVIGIRGGRDCGCEEGIRNRKAG
jgi:hypothetical protein